MNFQNKENFLEWQINALSSIDQKFEQECMQKRIQTEIITWSTGPHFQNQVMILHLYIFSGMCQPYLQSQCQVPYFLTEVFRGICFNSSHSLKHIHSFMEDTWSVFSWFWHWIGVWTYIHLHRTLWGFCCTKCTWPNVFDQNVVRIIVSKDL